ncbi:MAG: HDOD domain-containing protein, partial [Fibrobacter sp.]|nr:HDOD domain-containing protein [Fibrobacter sp.]
MITILMIIQNPREAVLLRKVFLAANIRIISSVPSYASYLKTLQYDPDIVVMELPSDPKNHIQFLKIIRNNKAIEQKPFIIYGEQFSDEIVKSFYDAGANSYLQRPLDLKLLIEKIRDIVKTSLKRTTPSEGVNQLTTDERELLLDKTIPLEEKLLIMRKHIGKLLAFPATVASILKVSQNEKSGAGELAHVIRADPAMSAEILKLANSVYFSRGGRRILDIKDAVVRIGFAQAKNIAMSLSVFEISKERNYATGFDHTEYWFHCIAVATIAEKLAKVSQLIPQEEAFIAGLLHDLGTLLFNNFFNDLFLKILEKVTDEGLRFIHYQKEIIGLNQNDLMSELFAEWNFPEVLCNDIKLVHQSGIITREFLEAHPMAGIVSIADVIAKSLQVGRSADCCVEPVTNETLLRLRMPYGIQPAFLDKLYQEINMFNEILNIDRRVYPLKNDQVKDADKINLLCLSASGVFFNPVTEYLKTQGYNVVSIKNTDELNDYDKKFHLLVVTDAESSKLDVIRPFMEMKFQKFNYGTDTDHDESTKTDASMKNRTLIFDQSGEFSFSDPTKNVVISKYPVDLRTIDVAISCLLSDLPVDGLVNSYGVLKPLKNVSNPIITSKKRRILVANFQTECRKKFVSFLSSYSHLNIEEANDGIKALNLTRTQTEELSLLIISLEIPMLPCIDVIRRIMMSPYHRRAKFLVTMVNPEKEKLVPLIKIGIRDFIKEDITSEEFTAKLKTLG